MITILRSESERLNMKGLRENWFVVMVAICTVITSVSSVITDWLSLGFGWWLIQKLLETL